MIKILIVTFKLLLNEKSNKLSLIIEIIDQSTSSRINNNLRIILLNYLILHDDYPLNIKEILTDFNIIFDLFDVISKLDATNSEGPPH